MQLTSLLTPQEAFDLLESASRGLIDPTIQVRHKASPICRSVNLFYVKSQAEPSASAKTLNSPSNNIASSLSLANSFFSDQPLLNQCLKSSKRAREDYICVKYQGLNSKFTDFFWSEKHGYKKGVAIRSMAKVLRKTRAKESSASLSPSTVSHAQPLEKRKHGLIGKLFTLVERESSTMPYLRSEHHMVSNIVVKGVPSLVSFCSDPAKQRNCTRKDKFGWQASKVAKTEPFVAQSISFKPNIASPLDFLGNSCLNVKNPLSFPLLCPQVQNPLGWSTFSPSPPPILFAPQIIAPSLNFYGFPNYIPPNDLISIKTILDSINFHQLTTNYSDHESELCQKKCTEYNNVENDDKSTIRE